MSSFKLVRHQHTPLDQYVKEVAFIEVTLQLEGGKTCDQRILYLYKQSKDGRCFWDVASTGITVGDKKEYMKACMFSDAFLKDDIIDLLNSRPWDKVVQQKYQKHESALEPVQVTKPSIDSQEEPLPF